MFDVLLVDKVYQRRRHGSVAAADNDEESMALMSCSSAPLRKVKHRKPVILLLQLVFHQ